MLIRSVHLTEKIKALGLTSEELAERLRLSDSFVRQVKRGVKKPEGRFLIGLMREFPDLREEINKYLMGGK